MSNSRFTKSPVLIGLVASLAWLAVSCSSPQLATDSPKSPLRAEYLYDTLLFEIAPITSCTPDAAALSYFRSKLEEYRICRREGVFFLTHPEINIIPPVPWQYSLIHQFERQFRQIRDPDPSDRVGVIFVSYIKGPIMKAGGKIGMLGGMQYSPTAFTIWKDGAGGREAGVLMHELAHLIGLKKGAEDPKNHCSRRYCIMWTSVGSPYASFCDDCEEELARIIQERQ